jgi:hypothetical protein
MSIKRLPTSAVMTQIMPSSPSPQKVSSALLRLRIPDVSMRTQEMIYSANTDPELTDWLRWAAAESSQVPMLVKTVAEAASI